MTYFLPGMITILFLSHLLPRHSIALVTGPSSGSPARYLDPDDRILSVKAGAPIAAMFVLCVHMPGQALLEAIDSIRQNVCRKENFMFILNINSGIMH